MADTALSAREDASTSHKHSEASNGDFEDDDETEAESSLGGEDDVMPLLFYRRLVGSFPRSNEGVFDTECTCAEMGQVILNSQSVMEEQQSDSPERQARNIPFLQWQGQPIPLVISGFANGTVLITDSSTGASLKEDGSTFSCIDANKKLPIVAVSVDGTGTAFAAIDQGGNCRIWTVSYRLTYRPSRQQGTNGSAQPTASLTNFFWRTTTASQKASSGAEAGNESADDLVPTLTIAEIKSQQIIYAKRDYGVPTCFSVDPAYRKTNKVLVAFDSGKLVMTAPNWMFRSEHTLLSYPGAPLTDPDWRGIERIEWRGSLLVFADCSGVKLYDTSTLKPVAHIDRPAGVKKGARASLCFETKDSLLVAWGDCLMNLHVTTHSASPQQALEPNGSVLRRRTVSCRMAWSLDCIAAGVAPVDENHVAVLGYDDEDFEDSFTLEFQILDRRNGQLTWADVLPLQEPTVKAQSSILSTMKTYSSPLAAKIFVPPNFMLMSSYATPRMDETLEMMEYQKAIVDPFMEWDLQNVEYSVIPPIEQDNDTLSIDSDCYNFLFQSKPSTNDDTVEVTYAPPVFVIASGDDMVQGMLRTVDDAITYAVGKERSATALKHAIKKPSMVHEHSMTDLINAYFHSLLSSGKLSLRRMKMAAEAMPLLLGADAQLWDQWTTVLGEVPGALFVVRSIIPVRDPILPKHVYARVIDQMLTEVEVMKSKSAGKLVAEAEGHFLNTLIEWGTTHCLHEHSKLYQQASKTEASFEGLVKLMNENLRHRSEQTAVGYLDVSAAHNIAQVERNPTIADSANDALYSIPSVVEIISQRVSFDEAMSPGRPSLNSRIALDCLARLHMMKQEYEKALRCFLFLGTLHSDHSLESIEENGLLLINMDETENESIQDKRPYSFILPMISNQDLHDCLLDMNILPDVVSTSPICALIRLVGLESMGDFLIDHCGGPEQKDVTPKQNSTYLPPSAANSRVERRGTLPLDLVADQLSGSPRLLLWYLHLVFTRKPEVYVKFPNTTTPPLAVTSLHKKHLDLHIKFAGPNRDSANALSGIEAYRVAEKSTPLLAFLKVVLKLGAISAVGVGKMLEIERRGGAGVSRIFALELAYIMENFGSNSESDAQLILELYLKGTQSLMLAVSYAQRMKKFSTILWDTLVTHCLSEKTDDGCFDGRLFGSLLEAAALSGADLAQLVAKIPPGMQVEGLRPRLVAAVADYRLKVQLHETSSEVASEERLILVQETAQRMRRGLRVGSVEEPPEEAKEPKSADERLKASMKTKIRPPRYHHAVSVPIR